MKFIKYMKIEINKKNRLKRGEQKMNKEIKTNTEKYLELEKELLEFLKDSFNDGKANYNYSVLEEKIKKFKRIGFIRTKEIQYKFIFENKDISLEIKKIYLEKFSRLMMFIENLNREINFKEEEIKEAKIYDDIIVSVEFATTILTNFFKKDYQHLFNLTKKFSDYEYKQVLNDCIYIIEKEGYEDYFNSYEQYLFINAKKDNKEKIKKDIIEDIKNLFEVSYSQFFSDDKIEYDRKADYRKVKYEM